MVTNPSTHSLYFRVLLFTQRRCWDADDGVEKTQLSKIILPLACWFVKAWKQTRRVNLKRKRLDACSLPLLYYGPLSIPARCSIHSFLHLLSRCAVHEGTFIHQLIYTRVLHFHLIFLCFWVTKRSTYFWFDCQIWIRAIFKLCCIVTRACVGGG